MLPTRLVNEVTVPHINCTGDGVVISDNIKGLVGNLTSLPLNLYVVLCLIIVFGKIPELLVCFALPCSNKESEQNFLDAFADLNLSSITMSFVGAPH